MICPNCKKEGIGNAKFCTRCGTQLVNSMNTNVQQPRQVYNNYQRSFERYQIQELRKKDRNHKIWMGILGALIMLVLIMWMQDSANLTYLWEHAEERAEDAEVQLYMYENRGAMDKSIDALDEWFEIFK